MKKVCPRCNTSFCCREDRTELCHCTHIYLLPDVKTYVKENYQNCLCQACLRETNLSFHASGINPKFVKKQ